MTARGMVLSSLHRFCLERGLASRSPSVWPERRRIKTRVTSDHRREIRLQRAREPLFLAHESNWFGMREQEDDNRGKPDL